MHWASCVGWALVVASALSAVPTAQTPQPFPRGGTPPRPVESVPPAQPIPAPAPALAAPADPTAPTEAQLGFPIHPSAQFITSYDAGRGQRFYLFGVTASFTEMVAYYRSALRERGDLVFEQPPTHIFEIGRFREDTMAFPPSVTVKDFTWGGSGGYPNAKRGAQPERFSTIIQIVPAPPAQPTGR